MIACRRFLPRISAWGSVLSIFMFLTTLSFLLTTPHIDEGTQGFLMKDLVLLGAAVATAGEAFEAALEKQTRAWMNLAKEQI
jgi:reactive chlorine resistance protein C